MGESLPWRFSRIWPRVGLAGEAFGRPLSYLVTATVSDPDLGSPDLSSMGLQVDQEPLPYIDSTTSAGKIVIYGLPAVRR